MSDPRFDPRFQRGYSGPEPVPDAAAAPSPIRRVEPARPVAAPPSPPRLESERPAPRIPEPPASEQFAPDDAAAFWEQPRRNPFHIGLLVGGLVLLAVGGWLIWRQIDTFAALNRAVDYDVGAQTAALLEQQLAPAFVVAGFLSLVAWLVLGALGASAMRERS